MMRTSKASSNGSNGKGVLNMMAGVSGEREKLHIGKAYERGNAVGLCEPSGRSGDAFRALPTSPGSIPPPNFEVMSKVPSPEVKVRRRRHTREYKLTILKESDKVKGKPGAIGELLRREGLYSSTLAEWRRQRNEGVLGQTRGRKPRPPEIAEIEKLRKENLRLKERNRQCVLVIEAQKKISEILGIRQDNVPPMPEDEEE
jgi:transposase-like protein